jgi:hypothetical protein
VGRKKIIKLETVRNPAEYQTGKNYMQIFFRNYNIKYNKSNEQPAAIPPKHLFRVLLYAKHAGLEKK